jgi:hypothetical protein
MKDKTDGTANIFRKAYQRIVEGHEQEIKDRVEKILEKNKTELLCWVVFKEGVYRQGCGGVFSTLELAAEAARKLIAGEPDDYHIYKVVPFVLDKITEQQAFAAIEGGGIKHWYGKGELKEAPAVLALKREGITIREIWER